ncbi:preprotein translocase subunit SecG [bacterium]|nr:preprotein translocase subunit SecG [bacterium]
MFTFVSIIHIIMSVILILIVLLQSGKGSDLASAFGGGGSQTLFGSQGAASFLNKLTTVAAIMFMVTSLALAILSAAPDKSFMDDFDLPEETAGTTQPADTSAEGEMEGAVAPDQDQVPVEQTGDAAAVPMTTETTDSNASPGSENE